MKKLIKEIKTTIILNQKLDNKNKDYCVLINLAHRLIFELLLQVGREIKIEKYSRKIIYELVYMLREHTQGLEFPRSEYSELYEYNTCDYKIARELVFRFPGNTFEMLQDFVNSYYYDHKLVYLALQEAKKINPVKGGKLALEFAMPTSQKSKLCMQQIYWDQLKSTKRIPLDVFLDICSNSIMPFEIRRDIVREIKRRKLFSKCSPYYKYYLENIVAPAKSNNDIEQLFHANQNTITKFFKRA